MAKKKDDGKVVPMEAPPPKAGEWTEEELLNLGIKQLEDVLYQNLLARLAPVLDKYFDEQSENIAKVMERTIDRCYKVMLQHDEEAKKEDGDEAE